jgi:hypothetical protein
MPGGTDGLALARTTAKRWPTLPVLFTTGYSPNAIIDDGRLDARFRVIGKPYSLDLLAAKVCECLDGAEGPVGHRLYHGDSKSRSSPFAKRRSDTAGLVRFYRCAPGHCGRFSAPGGVGQHDQMRVSSILKLKNRRNDLRPI